MNCLFCNQPDAQYTVDEHTYHGTKSYKTGNKINFCNKECYKQWWDDLTWHLDVLDERMNSNIHFQRKDGMKGTYKGHDVDASWSGMDARYKLGEYEFQHRREHPKTCRGCCISSGHL